MSLFWKYLSVLVVVFVCISCNTEEERLLVVQKGEITGVLSGAIWVADAEATYMGDSQLRFDAEVYWKDTLIQRLSLTNIPARKGSFAFGENADSPQAQLCFVTDDQVRQCYELWPDGFKGNISIRNYDSEKREIEGVLALNLHRTERLIPQMPDTLEFYSGKFLIRLPKR